MDTTAISAKNASSERADDLVPSDTPQLSIDLDPPHVRKALTSAEDLKQEGNNHFRTKRWDEAIALYRSALGHLPRRPQSPNSTPEAEFNDDDNDTSRLENESNSKAPAQEAAQSQPQLPSDLEIDCAKARAVLNANISACYAKLGDHKEVVSACTEALKDDPSYIKALQRRATANEQINSWSALSGAQEDCKKLLELLPPTSPDAVSIRRTLATLPTRVEAAQKRETAEMLDKLKGLGNSLLGNFGLSTDNFQFVPNGQGGYSMNFVQNPE